jgi:hypothetical protein
MASRASSRCGREQNRSLYPKGLYHGPRGAGSDPLVKVNENTREANAGGVEEEEGPQNAQITREWAGDELPLAA